MRRLLQILYESLETPKFGAAKIFRSLQTEGARSRWTEWILGNASALLIVTAFLITWLPFPHKIPLDTNRIYFTLGFYSVLVLCLNLASLRWGDYYDSTFFRLFRIAVNLIVVSLLVWHSSGERSYFWFFYSLPIFQAIIYFEDLVVLGATAGVIILYGAISAAVAGRSGDTLDGALLVINNLVLSLLAFVLYWLSGKAREGRKLNPAEIKALQQTARDLAAQQDRNQLLQTITQRSVELLRAKSGGIYEYDSARGELTVIADYGNKRSTVGNILRLGEGMAGRVAQTGEPLRVDNYDTSSYRAPIYEPGLFCAVVEVPLMWEKNFLGVLYVSDDKKGRVFNLRDEYVLGLLASQATVALLEETRRRASELERKAQQLKLVNQIAAAVNSSLKLDEILQKAVTKMAHVFQVKECALVIPDWEAGYGQIVAEYQEVKDTTAGRSKIPLKGNPAVEWVMSHKKPLHIEDVQKDPLAAGSAGIFQLRRIKSILIIPVLVKGEVFATIGLDALDEPRVFSQEESELAQTIANQVAIAIENANAYAALHEKELYYESLVSGFVDAIIAVDEQGIVTEFNEGAERILGYSRAEVLGCSVIPLYCDPAEPRRIRALLIQSKEGKLIHHETEVRGKHGEQISILLSATLRYDGKGNRIGSIGFFKDLRKIKEAERGLKLLQDTSATIARSQSLKMGLDAMAEKMVTGLEVTFCHIMLLDNTDQMLRVEAAYPIPRPHSSALKWEPRLGEKLSLKDFPRFKQLLEGPGAQLFRKGDFFGGKDVIGYVQRKLRLQGLNSVLVIPLKVGENTFGICTLGEERAWERKPFTPEGIQLASAAAAEAAVLIDRLRLFEATRRRMEELEHLRTVSTSVAQATELHDVLGRIAEGAKEVVNADFTVIYPYESSRHVFEWDNLAAAGISEERLLSFKKDKLSVDGTAVTIMKRGLLWEDRSQSQSLGESSRKFLESVGVSSFAGIGLRVGNENMGVLFVNFTQPHFPDPDEEEILTSFAYEAALAIKKARLLARIRKELVHIHAIGRFTTVGETNNALRAIAKGIKEVLGCDAVTVYLYDETKGEINREPVTEGLLEEHGVKLLGRVSRESPVWKILQKGNAHFEDDVRSGQSLVYGPFVVREGIRSSAGIPLQISGHKVGILFVNYRRQHYFDEEEKETVLAFADQAAVAIANARLFEERVKKVREQEIDPKLLEGLALDLNDTTKKVRDLESLISFSQELLRLADPQEVMDRATAAAAAILEVEFCDIVVSISGGPLVMSAASGWERELIGTLKLDDGKGSQTGYTIMQGKPVIVEDYKTEQRFAVPSIVFQHGIKSGMSVPIVRPHEALKGAMLVHIRKIRNFTEEDVRRLQLIANQTAFCIENARRHQKLLDMEKLAAQATLNKALALSAKRANRWVHIVRADAASIKDVVSLFKSSPQGVMMSQSLKEVMDGVYGLAEKIRGYPLTETLRSEDVPESIGLDALVRERVAQLLQSHPQVQVEWDLALQPDSTVQAGRRWIIDALDDIILNAMEALEKVNHKKLVISSRSIDRNVEITIHDSGLGIPEAIRTKLGEEVIPKLPGEKGSGTGFAFAKMLIQSYGGDIKIASTGPKGTAVKIILPLEKRQN